LVGVNRHAKTLISLQWYVSVLTLRLAVYTLFGKARWNLGKNVLHPRKYVLPYTYALTCSNMVCFNNIPKNSNIV